MPVVSPPMNNGGQYGPGPMGYGPPMPQPGVHGPPPYAYQQGYYSPQGHPGVGGGPVPTPIPSQMTFHDQAEMARKMRDYEALTQIITQWNANRLDLFALSLPNEVRPRTSHSYIYPVYQRVRYNLCKVSRCNIFGTDSVLKP